MPAPFCVPGVRRCRDAGDKVAIVGHDGEKTVENSVAAEVKKADIDGAGLKRR